MKTRRVVETTFRDEVIQDAGLLGAQPVVGVGTQDTVLAMGVRRAGRGRRGRHGGHRTAGALLAVLGLLVASLLSGLAAGSPAAAKDKVVFHVGMLGEGVDSLNPFLGFQAPSYEMWGLTYDYLTGYTMKDMSPAPGLATKWTTSSDGKTWTFTVRSGVKFSDGVPLTAADVAYTYNRILHGTVEQSNWLSYLNGVTKVTAPNATTVVLKLKQPVATLPLLPIPIVPEHVWKNVSEKEIKSYPAEPTDGKPVVGSGPFRLVQGTADGSTFKFEANPDYWGGTPHIDEVDFQFYKNDDSAVQALIKGEIDFVDNITALEVKSLQSHSDITAHNGNSPGFDEIAFNTGSVSAATGGHPIGNPNPAVLDPKFRHALGYALNLPQLIQKAYQGAGLPGTTIVPPNYNQYHWEPPADQKFTFDLAKAGALLDAAGYTKGSDGTRNLPNGQPIGTLRLAARSDSPTSLDTMDFFKHVAQRPRDQERGLDVQLQPADRRDLPGQLRRLPVGLVRRAGPRLDAQLHDLRPAAGLVGLVLLQQAVRQALRRSSTSRPTRRKREAEVKKMQEILYQDSPYLVTAYSSIGEAVRSDRFACFVPQPNPGGIWIEQYGVYNYIHAKPAADAGTCDTATTTAGDTLTGAVQATAGDNSSSSAEHRRC